MKIIELAIKRLAVVVAILVITACGVTPEPMMKLDTNILSKQDLKVGVVVSLPKDNATTHIYGASCLVCYGVASGLTSSLDKHLKSSISTDELENIKQLIVDEYKNRNIDIKEIPFSKNFSKLKKFKTKAKTGFAKKNYKSFKKSHDIDLLVVLELYAHGAYRSFSGYVPNGDPMGYLSGKIFTVDLGSNSYVQYLEIDEKVQPEGEWDEPNGYPSVTTAYYQAIENAKNKVKDGI